MNYSCEYQNEIQSALWSRGSVTLFTGASIHRGECKTYLICSDTKDKEKNTVKAFIAHLYEHELKPNSPDMINVEEVIWTDGPSSEFKNRFMAKFLTQLSEKYRKTFVWKYTATSHGKGIVDGIGGRAKSLVRIAVMSKGQSAVIVQNAKDFARVVRELMPSTTVILIEDKEIPRSDKVWEETEEKEFQNPTSNIAVGNWVLVTYDFNIFPGEVIAAKNDEFEVNVMVKAGPNTWKWPKKEDRLWYVRDNVVKVINPPVVAGNRGQFTFSEPQVDGNARDK